MKTIIKSTLVCMMALMTIGLWAQRPQGERQQMTPEQRAKQRTEQLKKDLGLNETQEAEVYDLQLKLAKEMQTIRSNAGEQPDREKMRTEMEKFRAEESAGMKKILTEEQFEKWEKQQAERMKNSQNREQQNRQQQHNRNKKQA